MPVGIPACRRLLAGAVLPRFGRDSVEAEQHGEKSRAVLKKMIQSKRIEGMRPMVGGADNGSVPWWKNGSMAFDNFSRNR